MYVGIEAFQHQLLFAPLSILELIMHCNGKSPLQAVMLFHIYTEFINDNHLNDDHNISPNRIFDTILKTPIAQTKHPLA